MPAEPSVRPLVFEWRVGIRESSLGPLAKLVAYTLGTYMHADGTNAYPSNRTLAASCGLSVRSVQNELARLEDAGWIVANAPRGDRAKTGRKAIWAAQLPTEPMHPGAQVPMHGGAQVTRNPCTPVHPPMHHGAGDPCTVVHPKKSVTRQEVDEGNRKEQNIAGARSLLALAGSAS